MKKSNLVLAILAALVLIGLVVLAVKLISGAFALLGGLLNTVLGLVLIAATVAIVVWMFRYAKSKK